MTIMLCELRIADSKLRSQLGDSGRESDGAGEIPSKAR